MCFLNYRSNYLQHSFKVFVPVSNLNIRSRYFNELVAQCSHFSRNLKRCSPVNNNLRYLSFFNKIIFVHNRNSFVIISAQLQQEIPQVVNRVLQPRVYRMPPLFDMLIVPYQIVFLLRIHISNLQALQAIIL